MADTSIDPNNRAVVYRGKPVRERPRSSSLLGSPQQSAGPADALRASDGAEFSDAGFARQQVTAYAKGGRIMPWTGKSFAAKHNKKLSGKAASSAARQATAMVRSGVDEGIAIATANKRANKLKGYAVGGRIDTRNPEKDTYKNLKFIERDMENRQRSQDRDDVEKLERGPKFPGRYDQINGVPAMRKGGNARVGEPVIVGEKGPELFVADKPGTVVPNNQLRLKRKSGAISDRALQKRPRLAKYSGNDMDPIDASSR